MKPIQEYSAFQAAYDYFNRVLFGDALPVCMITLQRKPKAGGYFWAEKFQDRRSAEHTDEIALNPDYFQNHDDAFILSILVHEMAHLWQSHHGTPSRSGYHNQEWAAKMLALGLSPVSYDQPGKMTGQKVSHEIIPGGAFDIAVRDLLASGFTLTWQSITAGDGEEKQKKRQSKTKYTCPGCGVNAWAKPETHLVCGDCMEPMAPENLAEAAALLLRAAQNPGQPRAA